MLSEGSMRSLEIKGVIDSETKNKKNFKVVYEF